MRIGILTLPLHTNYGGILQAYALQTVLERLGHEVKVINRNINYELPLWKIPFVYSKRIIKNILGYKTPLFYEQKLIKEQPIIRQNTDRFIRQYIHTLNVDNYTDLREEDFDAIVVGSDQVWRPKYFGKIEDAYLQFAKGWNIKRIAYAASFGTDEWEYSLLQTRCCRSLAKKFDAVSVREDSGVDLCQKYLDIQASHVLDPTMLLTKEDYIKNFNLEKYPKNHGNLFCYILDSSPPKNDLINSLSMLYGLKPFNCITKIDSTDLRTILPIQPSVELWLKGFYDAEFVITDSFHGTVFSIIFNKPFIAIANKERGLSRFTSVLKLLGLEDRLIFFNDNIPLSLNKKNIDYETVNSKIKKNKEKIIQYVRDLL